MDHPPGSAAELVRHWTSRSEQFLEAAAHLPATEEMAPPRAALLARAVEYRLKAFLWAARGGAPVDSDLGHLTELAVHCGLALAREPRDVIALLDGAQREGASLFVGVETEAIAALCRDLSSQTPPSHVGR